MRIFIRRSYSCVLEGPPYATKMTASNQSIQMLRQLKYGFRIRRRKTFVGSFAIRQPAKIDMFARRQPHRDLARHLQAEHMLGIMRDLRRIAMPPYRIDLVHVRKLPIAEID